MQEPHTDNPLVRYKLLLYDYFVVNRLIYLQMQKFNFYGTFSLKKHALKLSFWTIFCIFVP